MSSSANPEKNYLPMPHNHHTEILKIAEELYDNLLKVVVDNTIYPIAPMSTCNVAEIIRYIYQSNSEPP
jgi:hypothetical protein